MKKSFKIAFAISSALAASGVCEARRMEKVIVECEPSIGFNDFADCLRKTYSKKGNSKSAGVVLTFYALVEEIRETYNVSQKSPEPMSEVQARSNVMRAWQATINSENVGERSRSCSMRGKSLVCE